jgi:hypothetical protein
VIDTAIDQIEARRARRIAPFILFADFRMTNLLGAVSFNFVVRACLKSRMRGHVIVGEMTISTDVDSSMIQI